ncbi:L-aspartate oxidase [Macrococcoides goetzii]|uniref:L-aspartate oxidase n=1 Tax=Macrococcus TaxID=69965 RepID=UPI001EF22C94|nr:MULTISPECIES: FAD-binding protein [Macrococcus]MCG7418852.1 FAD-binding protein [Macrococcus epidermidis]MCH4984351.1 FAD-binding protein [Macrococcus sp. PK]MCH4985732.1 FAD-binding protein [Macrococcus sp. PK]
MYDVIIVGGGISALSLLRYLPKHYKVAVVMENNASSSVMAQGGIASSLFESSIESHVQDTYTAGCNYGDIDVIRKMIETGNHVVRDLINRGIEFDQKSGLFDLGMEGAHAVPRIFHMNHDQTGQSLCAFMRLQLQPQVEMIYGRLTALHKDVYGKVCGISVDDKILPGQFVVLATGGYSGMFQPASNPSVSGVYAQMLALLSGCTLRDLEMIQFHPTMLTIDNKAICLVSEAVRGAGGVLVNEHGEAIMAKYLQRDLSPRHITSYEIFSRIQNGERIYLDISNIRNFAQQFPFIHAQCEQFGLSERIPVAPGAHYTMGGIAADVNGATAVDNLFVIGEAACTGFHGANRLASNSLLEGLAMGKLLGDTLINKTLTPPGRIFSTVNIQYNSDFDHESFMKYVGIVRDTDSLNKYLSTLNSNDTLTVFARLIAECAINRTSTLGAHVIKDKDISDSDKTNIVKHLNGGTTVEFNSLRTKVT